MSNTQSYTLTQNEIETMLKSAILTGQNNNIMSINDVLKLWANCIIEMRLESINDDPNLTNTEKIVYELLLQGLNAEEISEKLIISKSTAKKHIHNILTKNNVSSVCKLLANEVLRLRKINKFMEVINEK